MRKKLEDIYLSKKGFILSHDRYKELRIFLQQNTAHLNTENLSERLYVMFNDNYVNDCNHCGKPTAFQNSVVGYRKYCSNDCKRQHIYNDDRSRKMRETCLKNHGVENPGQSKIIKEKIKETCIKTYGVDHPVKSNAVKEKMRETCLKNHGVENPGQSKIIKEKIKETCIKTYGVDHNLKIPYVREIVNQKLRDIFANREFGKFYTYAFPSGKTVRVQGFEMFALDELLQINDETNIIVGRKNIYEEIGHVNYNDCGIIREYFPDIYIKSNHKIIEVKSEYTYNLHLQQNLIKKESCIEQGYDFEFWIYDKNKNKIIK
jgi:hypothetical protein